MYLLFLLVLGYVAIHLAFFADTQRATFGDSAGNILLTVEVTTIVTVGVVGWLWSRRQKKVALAVGLASAAALLAFIGWFVQPERRYERAVNRMFDWDRALDDYRVEQQYSPDPPEERNLHLRRLRAELAARKLELRAAEVRFNGEPDFFRSNFISWMLWIDSLIFVVGAIFVLRLPNNTLETDAR